MTNTYSKANALGAPLSLRTAKRNRRDANNKREINKIKNIGSSKVIPASRGASGDQGATGFKAGIDPSKLVGSLQRKPKPRGPKNSSAATMTKDKAPTKLQQLDKKLGGLKRTPKQQAKIDKDKRKVNVTAKPTLQRTGFGITKNVPEDFKNRTIHSPEAGMDSDESLAEKREADRRRVYELAGMKVPAKSKINQPGSTAKPSLRKGKGSGKNPTSLRHQNFVAGGGFTGYDGTQYAFQVDDKANRMNSTTGAHLKDTARMIERRGALNSLGRGESWGQGRERLLAAGASEQEARAILGPNNDPAQPPSDAAQAVYNAPYGSAPSNVNRDEFAGARSESAGSEFDRAGLSGTNEAGEQTGLTRNDIIQHMNQSKVNGVNTMTYAQAKQEIYNKNMGAQGDAEAQRHTAMQNILYENKTMAEIKALTAAAARQDQHTKALIAAGADPWEVYKTGLQSADPKVRYATALKMMEFSKTNFAGSPDKQREFDDLTKDVAYMERRIQDKLDDIDTATTKYKADYPGASEKDVAAHVAHLQKSLEGLRGRKSGYLKDMNKLKNLHDQVQSKSEAGAEGKAGAGETPQEATGETPQKKVVHDGSVPKSLRPQKENKKKK